jgi:hypothetical protein
MKSKASFITMVALAAGTLLGAVSGCELIASIDRNQIQGSGGAGAGTATGGGGTTSSGTTTTTTTTPTECVDPTKDCPAPSGECKVAACDADKKCTENNVADDMAATTQQAGDCKKNICKAGAVASADDDTDLPDDAKDCTVDGCNAGAPTTVAATLGTMCNDGGGAVCDDASNCVECNADPDCATAGTVCDEPQHKCVPASCMDNVKNVNETDKDCGGPDCSACADGLACAGATDCTSKVCTTMVCQVPACDDNVQNGMETDQDCGGTCVTKCGPDKGCDTNADCAGNQCSGVGGTCTPNCADGTTNNMESDTDCGGPNCGATCIAGDDCGGDTDCIGATFCNMMGKCTTDKVNGQGCMGTSQCVSGNCVDTVCCDLACSGTCLSCNLAGAVGACTFVASGQDPDSECAGTDVCNGAAACGKATGDACGAGAECATGQCVDGVCCNSACGALCKACTMAKTGQANGTCANISTNTDPDNECVGSVMCSGGACPLLVDGTACTLNTECENANCVDGVCCNNACGGLCQACSAVKKGQGADGTCGAIKINTDPDMECAGTMSCNGAGACVAQPLGAACAMGTECASTFCADGVCCNQACGGACRGCAVVGTVGTCSLYAAGTDPDNECNGADPTCNGSGICAP